MTLRSADFRLDVVKGRITRSSPPIIGRTVIPMQTNPIDLWSDSSQVYKGLQAVHLLGPTKSVRTISSVVYRLGTSAVADSSVLDASRSLGFESMDSLPESRTGKVTGLSMIVDHFVKAHKTEHLLHPYRDLVVDVHHMYSQSPLSAWKTHAMTLNR